MQTKPVEFCAKADAARSGTKARLDSLPIIAAEVLLRDECTVLGVGWLPSCVRSRPYTSIHFLDTITRRLSRSSKLLASLIARVPADRHAYMSCGVSVLAGRLAACLGHSFPALP